VSLHRLESSCCGGLRLGRQPCKHVAPFSFPRGKCQTKSLLQPRIRQHRIPGPLCRCGVVARRNGINRGRPPLHQVSSPRENLVRLTAAAHVIQPRPGLRLAESARYNAIDDGTSALLEHSLAAGMGILAPGSRTTPKKLYRHLRLPEPENFRARPVIKGVVF